MNKLIQEFETLDSNSSLRLGIDWGGTKIEVIAIDGSGSELFRKRLSTPKNDYEGCLRTVKELVTSAESHTGMHGTVGFGIPGTVSPATGLVKNANSQWMNGKPLESDLESLLNRPVRIQNDANCLAVSEATDGAGKGCSLVLAVIIGTGCGSGIAINGEALTGHGAIAGEIGHMPLPWMTEDEFPGVDCWCGLRGCLETYVSGTGLERDYEMHAGRTSKGPEILAKSVNGDRQALEALERYENRLARGLAAVVGILDPDVIVLGGGMSNADRLYQNLPRLIAPFVFTDEFETPIRKAVHGDSSGVRGAAWLW